MDEEPLARASVANGTTACLSFFVPVVLWVAIDFELAGSLTTVLAGVVVVVIAALSARETHRRLPTTTWEGSRPVSTARALAGGVGVFLLLAAVAAVLCLVAQSWGGLGLVTVLGAGYLGRAVALAAGERRAGVWYVEDEEQAERYIAVRR
jgi:hypothetical protein